MRTLFEDALTEEKQTVAREGCTETWTIYHIVLGRSLTVTVQTSRGTRKERLNKIEDLPAVYSQIVRSMLSGAAVTNDSSAVDRKERDLEPGSTARTRRRYLVRQARLRRDQRR